MGFSLTHLFFFWNDSERAQKAQNSEKRTEASQFRNLSTSDSFVNPPLQLKENLEMNGRGANVRNDASDASDAAEDSVNESPPENAYPLGPIGGTPPPRTPLYYI
jgi:hypothetical protein